MMADHGLHAIHPARRMARLCLQYPWSLLWLLTMTVAASVAAGVYALAVIILGGQGIILLHSFHLDRMRRRRRD